MKLILHRRNTLADLKTTSVKYGVEVDIRSSGEKLIIQHDPFLPGVLFDEWIALYQHNTLILNVKEEGLEIHLIAAMNARGIKDYFFLDQSFPFLLKLAKSGESRCAVRVSEYESIETAINLAGKVDWVWIDCFSRFPLSKNDTVRLRQAGFKLCVVSPELQGRDAQIEIPQLAQTLNGLTILPNAVCTKHPDLWERYVGEINQL